VDTELDLVNDAILYDGIIANQSAEYGRCKRKFFFKKYISNKGIKTALHAQDLVEFCHILQMG